MADARRAAGRGSRGFFMENWRKKRVGVSISPSGLHWESLDEDISIEGLLAGRGDMTRASKRAA